jgi:hypothetical protein
MRPTNSKMMRAALIVAAATPFLVNRDCRSAQGHEYRDGSSSSNAMVLQDFNGQNVPRNRAGDPYPSVYTGEGSTGTVRLNTSDAIAGNSLEADITAKGLYLQFNPFEGPTRGFARDYSADPGAWRFNTYNRMSFWIKRPRSASPLFSGGRQNVQFGTFVKRVANADRYSSETGGGHYYHMLNLPNDGRWTQVILNMHPDHQRGNSGAVDPGFLRNPTREPTINYFDSLTSFYIDDTASPRTGSYLIDEILFYREPAAENDAQVYSLTGTHDPATNRLTVTWNHAKGDGNSQEVRYAFSDIHQIGWNAARRAGKGITKPPDPGGYNGMVFITEGLPLAGHAVVYIAIKPQNSKLFSQIAIPLGHTKSADTPRSAAPRKKGS